MHIPDEQKLLKRVKIGIVLMLAVFGVQLVARIPEYWPLTRWAMYSRVGPAPETYSDFRLVIIDTSGANHILHTSDLGFKGQDIVYTAFRDEDEEERTAYRSLLSVRVGRALQPVEPVVVEVWEDRWDIAEWDVPPFVIETPTSSSRVGLYPVAFYERTAPDDQAVDLHFGDSLGLLEFNLIGSHQVTQCGQLFVHSGWRTLAPVQIDYQITLVLADQNGIGRAQNDGPLANSLTSTWQPSSDHLDRRIIDIPCDLPAGAYSLLVGLYDLETVQNLPITYLDGAAYGSLAYLTTIEVVEGEAQ
jgi:hypothetical protein